MDVKRKLGDSIVFGDLRCGKVFRFADTAYYGPALFMKIHCLADGQCQAAYLGDGEIINPLRSVLVHEVKGAFVEGWV